MDTWFFVAGWTTLLALTLPVLLFAAGAATLSPSSSSSLSLPGAESTLRDVRETGMDPVTLATVVPVGSDLEEIEFDRTRDVVYVADRLRDEIISLSLVSLQVDRTISVGNEPVALALSPSGQTLYVGHAGDLSIYAIDLDRWEVERIMSTGFLTWDLVATAEDELVATTHDPVFPGENPYVVDAINGAVRQRLNPGESLHMDAILAQSPDRDRVYLAPTMSSFSVYTFQRGADKAWAFLWKSDFGSGAPAASDIAVSPDGRWLYASMGARAVGISTDFASSGPVGGSTPSATIALAPTGQFVVTSGRDNGIFVFDVSAAADPGTFAGFPDEPVRSLNATDRVWRLRVSPDGSRLVLLVGISGDARQDVEVMPVGDIGFVKELQPTGLTNLTSPTIRARVVAFRSLSGLSGRIVLDGTVLAAEFDGLSGLISANAGVLGDGPHSVVASAVRGGADFSRVVWSFTIDTIPPEIFLDAIPPVVAARTVIVSGTVTDANPWLVTIGDRSQLIEPDGRFAVPVQLEVGLNALRVVATDRAGNAAEVSLQLELRLPEVWLVHDPGHFRIRILDGWVGERDVAIGNETVDAVLTRATTGATVLIDSETRFLDGDGAEARAILNGLIADVPASVEVNILEPTETWTLDGHPAARAVIALSVIGSPQIIEIVAVVLGPEWDRVWVVVAATTVGTWYQERTELEAAIAEFDVTSRSPIPPFFSSVTSWIALAAVAVTALAVFFVVQLDRKQRRP